METIIIEILSAVVGILIGLLIILLVGLIKYSNKLTLYGIVLSGIAFIYVGFTWTDIPSLFIVSLQIMFFILLSYYGVKKNSWFLVIGYFLHGIWDLAYGHFQSPNLIVNYYDTFCLSADFFIGGYLIFKYQMKTK